MNMLVSRYPLFIWSKLIKDNEEVGIEIENDERVFIPITITSSNIKSLLLDRLANAGTSSDILAIADSILTDAI